jgi:hypothetical protein
MNVDLSKKILNRFLALTEKEQQLEEKINNRICECIAQGKATKANIERILKTEMDNNKDEN